MIKATSDVIFILVKSNTINPDLGGRGVFLPPFWFFLNHSETVKAVALT